MRLFDWLSAIARRVRPVRFRRRNRRFRPGQLLAEMLETRQLPSAVTFTGTPAVPGVLQIDLSESSVSTVSVSSTFLSTVNGPVEVARVAINGSLVSIRQVASQSALNQLPISMVSRIVIQCDSDSNTIDLSGVNSRFGLQQADEVNGQRPLPMTTADLSSLSSASFYGVIVQAAGGDDRIVGSPFREFIDAGSGRDTILGQAGDDELRGGSGNDIVSGSQGDDRLYGGADADVIVGGYGRDSLDGEAGDDLLIGGVVDFEAGQIAGLMTLRDRWLASATNEEVRRQTIAPWQTTLVGVDDNRDGLVDRNSFGRPNDAVAASTRIVVSESMADAFDPAKYGTNQPSGTNFLARLGGELVRIVSRISTFDLQTEVLLIEHVVHAQAVAHEVGESLVVQALANQTPFNENSLWSAPVGTTLAQTLFDDFAANTLTGADGRDFLIVSDELLSFKATSGDPRWAADDVLTDLSSADARYRAVNTSPESKRLAVPSGTIEPGFGESLAALRGTVTKLAGDPGTEVLTANRIGADADSTHLWGGLVRTAYVTNPSFNVSSDLVHLGSFPATNGGPNELGQTRWDYLLSTDQLDQSQSGITPVTPDFISRNWRWSQNPLEPNVEYGFVSGVGPNGQFSGVQKYRFLNNTDAASNSSIAQEFSHQNQTLVFTSFDPMKSGGLPFISKSTLYFNSETGHNYTVMVGNPRRADRPDEFDRSVLNVYVVDLDIAALPDTPANANKWADPVLASFALTAPEGTAGYPYGSKQSNIDDFYVSPDGRYIMVCYVHDTGGGFRLLDVDLARGQISPHLIPVTPTPDEDIPALRQEAVRQNGFFPFKWHHPVFALGASGKSYVVGQPGKWSKDNLVSPNIEYLAGGNTIGQLVRFDPAENKYASLTNPVYENITASRETLSHVAATNTQNPGYVFVSYYSGTDPFTANSPAYKGAIVAVDIEQPTGPNGAIVLARHQTQGAEQYITQPMINASSDGTRVLFQSTWGNYQQSVSTYQLTPGSQVELIASGAVVLRRTGINKVALFANAGDTTPIVGTQRTISAFDTLVVRTPDGQSLQLTIDFAAGSPVPSGGVLEVDGTATSGDQIQLLNATGGQWDWSLTGDGAGQLRGPSSGLIRFRGIESFNGGEGNDVFHLSPNSMWHGVLSGGAGSDTLNFAAFSTGVTASLWDGSVAFTSSGGSFSGSVSQFENVTGGMGNDLLTGDGTANVLQGGEGNDILNGQSGPDQLLGDGGSDTIRGGSGADDIDGGNGDDLLFGQNDADLLTGGLGNDTFDGGAGDDTVIEFGNGNAVLATTSLIGFSGIDTLTSVELARLTGGAGDNLFNASGFSGSVTLLGGDGNDTLLDATGDDSLSGGAGNDVFRLIGLGTDIIIETVNDGSDTLDYSAAVGSVNIDLARTTRQDVRSGHRLTLSANAESFVGSSYADVITMTVVGSSIRSVDGGDGELAGDRLQVQGSTNVWTLNGASSGQVANAFASTPVHFTNVESVEGGEGHDSFAVTGSRFQGNVAGGAGDNTLDLSALATGMSIALTSNDSTGFSGSLRATSDSTSTPDTKLRGINAIIGTAQNDRLVGLSTDAHWDVLTRLYSDLANGRGLRWDSLEVLIGGDRRDSFVNVQTGSPITLGGGAGDDTIDASQASSSVTLLGGEGNDELYGGSIGDLLDGGDGDDTLLGGSGSDQLFGQAGLDVFDDTSGLNTLNGGTGNDSMRIIGTWSLTPSASLPVFVDIETICGSGAADILSGSTSAEAMVISSNGVTVGGSKFTFQGFETINGGLTGQDTISGTHESDTFFVSPTAVSAFGSQLIGFEFLQGGGGTDRLQGSDQFQETFTVGPSSVKVNNMTSTFSEFEVLSGGGGNDIVVGPGAVGGPRVQWLISEMNAGSVAGILFDAIETVRGGAGDDTFVILPSGTMNRIDGGGGSRDWLDYSAFTTAVAVNLTTQQATVPNTIAGISGVWGGSGDDVLIGSGSADWLDGREGNDWLEGQGGDDRLTGGIGDDKIFGGGGTGDLLVESRDAHIVLSTTSLGFDGRIEDQVLGIERAVITGGSSANEIDARKFTGVVTLFGADGHDSLFGGTNNDSLDGANGDDVLVGGAGTDTLDGAAGRDILDDIVTGSLIRGGDDSDVFRMTGTWTIATPALPTNISSVESIVGGGLSDTLIGTALAEQFSVTDAGIITFGGSGLSFSGFEFVSAGAGKVLDTLKGSTTDDLFVLGATGSVQFRGVTFSGIEVIDGASGQDRLSGSAANDQFSAEPNGSVKANGVSITGFETIAGGEGVDRLAGSITLADVFRLTSQGVQVSGVNGLTFIGFEALAGDGGNDTLQVAEGAIFNGSFEGGAGLDVVDFSLSSTDRSVTLTSSSTTGFAGREAISGASFLAIESLNAGNGIDTLTGLGVTSTWNIGGKTYTDASLKALRVLKWNSFESFIGGLGRDTFNNVTGAVAVTLNGGAGADVLDASAATASVKLEGGAGNDILKGGRAADVLDGGIGNDTLDGLGGEDTLFGGGDTDQIRQ